MTNEFKYNLIRHVGDLTNPAEKYVKEVNVLDWCRYIDEDDSPLPTPKLDIRNWTINHKTGERRAGKGITLTRDQAKRLLEILKTFDFNEIK